MTIELINRLARSLNEEGLTYCHWKSNCSLAESLAGKIDLDLLVDRRSFSRFEAILASQGFKQATVRTGKGAPGIYHFYGLDYQSGSLIHVHLFSRVLTGESFIKSHLLPFEAMLFESTYMIDQLRVPAKPAELVLFILRTFIKYGSLLDLVYVSRGSREIKVELEWLLDGSNLSESLALLKQYCPVIEESLFIKCVDAIRNGGPLIEKILLAQQVRARLRVYAKNGPLASLVAYAQLLWEQGVRRLTRDTKNKMLSAGGAVIAFVGPEATGKSTLVSETGRWLGQVFALSTVHAGKPPSTWLTAPLNLVLPWVRELWPRLRTSRLEGHAAAEEEFQAPAKMGGLSGLVYAVRSVTLAWDRRQLLARAGRSAAKDRIIICDRYPSETTGAMDSPRLDPSLEGSGATGALVRRLARLEHRLYAQIPPPDVVIRLKVSVETAKVRNRERIKAGKETDAYLESRHRQMREWSRPGTKYVYEINTEQPLEETIRCVKEAIWEAI